MEVPYCLQTGNLISLMIFWANDVSILGMSALLWDAYFAVCEYSMTAISSLPDLFGRGIGQTGVSR